VYWYKEGNCVIIQQRSQIRMGGRGEYVDHLMKWIKQCEFANVIVLTSEFATSRTAQQIAQGLNQVYYCFTSSLDIQPNPSLPLSTTESNEIKDQTEEEKKSRNSKSKSKSKPKLTR